MITVAVHIQNNDGSGERKMAISKKKITQRSLNAMETKEKLFSTALALFAKYGFTTVTVEDITRYAGFSKGTFYSYFPTKESVLIEQFRMIDAHYEQVFKAVPDTAGATERIMILIDAMCDYCANVVGVEPLQIIYANQITSPDTIHILNGRDRVVYQIMRDSIERGKASGEFPKNTDLQQTAELMMRSARGLIYDWCMYNASFDLQEEGKTYFTSILHLIRLSAQNSSVDKP